MGMVTDLLEGFWTWQTPVSFLAGVGAYHLYGKLSDEDFNEDREAADVQEKR